jgi:hypothetical protein
MDAIDNLVSGSRRAQAIFDNAAQRLAAADLPTTQNPDPTNPASPAPRTQNVDVAEQLTAMTIAVDMHHVTTAALRSGQSLPRVDRPDSSATSGRLNRASEKVG